jgi:hypothetical protein
MIANKFGTQTCAQCNTICAIKQHKVALPWAQNMKAQSCATPSTSVYPEAVWGKLLCYYEHKHGLPVAQLFLEYSRGERKCVKANLQDREPNCKIKFSYAIW